MDRDALQEQILRFLDGELTPDEERALHDAIRGDRDAEGLLHQLVLQQGLIQLVLKEESGARKAVGAGTPEAAVPVRRRPRDSRPRASWMPWLAVAASVLLATAAGLYVFRSSPKSPAPALATLDLAGNGCVVLRGGKQIPLRTSDPLYVGDVLSAGNDPCRIQYVNESTRVALEAGSDLELAAPNPGKQLALRNGALSATVAPQPAGQPLVIQTPHARAEVVGTEFRLRVTADASELQVKTGAVRLSNAAGETVLATAGTQVRTDGRNPLSARRLIQSWDFEGAAPVGIGEVVPDPQQASNRCLGSGQYLERGQTFSCAVLDIRESPLNYAADNVVRFAYWVEEGSKQLKLQIYNDTRKFNLYYDLRSLTPRRWTTVEIRLDEMKTYGPQPIPAQPGDVLVRLLFITEPADGPRFFIDDVQWLKAGEPRPTR